MGNATSKAARKFPAPKPKPTWAGARTGEPVAPPSAQSPGPRPAQGPLATDSRDAAIEADARDPHFMANLGRLGQVKVDHHMETYRSSATRVNDMFHSRQQSELQASSSSHTVRNRVLSPTFAYLLSERQALPAGSPELAELANGQGIDVTVLERVGRYVNVPSVKPGSQVKKIRDDGSENIEMMAEWVDPVSNPQQRLGTSSGAA